MAAASSSLNPPQPSTGVLLRSLKRQGQRTPRAFEAGHHKASGRCLAVAAAFAAAAAALSALWTTTPALRSTAGLSWVFPRGLWQVHNAGARAALVVRYAGSIEDYESLTMVQLKELLRERSLPVSGKKAALIQRLMRWDEANPEGLKVEEEEEEEEEPEEEKSVKDDEDKKDADEDEDKGFKRRKWGTDDDFPGLGPGSPTWRPNGLQFFVGDLIEVVRTKDEGGDGTLQYCRVAKNWANDTYTVKWDEDAKESSVTYFDLRKPRNPENVPMPDWIEDWWPE
eukprot:TRINITY_DN34042_c0_g1_i1.p1 TRINITY_DN34042_c0_g1~~TRINITY_DN34042_c0_g1_i1.p1  ORF type:complete len:283 (-),score=87.09 TRINITY_DN34042_c0_g1_i1:93-941(-)